MPIRHVAAAAVALAVAVAPLAVAAQTAAEHIAAGDAAHAAMNPSEALGHYEAAIAADSQSYEAHWRASRNVVDLAEFEKDERKREAWFRKGEQYARKAVRLNPTDAEGHFSLARALGRVALTLGTKERIKYATDVRTHALEALKHDPNHPGALHVMGRWNAEVMRLNGVSRFVAKNLLGGKVFGEASWDNAERFMRKAVEVDPGRLTHRLDLAEILADRDKAGEARQFLQQVVDGQATDYNDRFYKDQAREKLRSLKS